MKYKVTLNGKIYEVEVSHGEAVLLEAYEAAAPVMKAPPPPAQPSQKAPAASAASSVTAEGEKVTAPMPGTILDIKVSAGQKVKEGESLVVLEAMKMENDVVAPRDGVVAQIAVQKGAAVDTDEPLLVLQ